MNIAFCLVKLKMPFSFRHYDFKLMREMVGFTAFVFIGIVVDNLNWSVDRLLLAWIHGTTAVTVYTVAAQLNVYYQSFATAISNLLIPRVNRIVAEHRPIRELVGSLSGWDGCNLSSWAVFSGASWPWAAPLWCFGAATPNLRWTTP